MSDEGDVVVHVELGGLDVTCCVVEGIGEQHDLYRGGYIGKYEVVVVKHKLTYGAYAPDVPGCVAGADDLVGVRQLITEALALHFVGMMEDGEELPDMRKINYTG